MAVVKEYKSVNIRPKFSYSFVAKVIETQLTHWLFQIRRSSRIRHFTGESLTSL